LEEALSVGEWRLPFPRDQQRKEENLSLGFLGFQAHRVQSQAIHAEKEGAFTTLSAPPMARERQLIRREIVGPMRVMASACVAMIAKAKA